MTDLDPASAAPHARFGPLAILTAIVCGSAMAIAFGLNAVLVIFWVLRQESQEVAAEIGHLPQYCLLFLGLTAVSCAAMYALLKQLPWSWRAQMAMWVMVAGIAWWFTRARVG